MNLSQTPKPNFSKQIKTPKSTKKLKNTKKSSPQKIKIIQTILFINFWSGF